MRQIKFRAWDGERMYAPIFTSGEFYTEIHGNSSQLVGSHELMQYTGLKDANGVEIYEGDVVNAKNWGRTNEIICVSVVEWDIDDKGWGLNPDPTSGDRYDLFRNVEVIGNIYENPELLK